MDAPTAFRPPVRAVSGLIADAMMKAGLPPDDARKVANLMLEADLTGADAHGVFRLPQYIARLRMGAIKKSFGKNLVLNGIDLTVRRGEVLAIIGPSGSGKSTLLRCANRLETIDSGTIANAVVNASAPAAWNRLSSKLRFPRKR